MPPLDVHFSLRKYKGNHHFFQFLILSFKMTFLSNSKPQTLLLRSIPFSRHPYWYIGMRHLTSVSADIWGKCQMSALTDVRWQILIYQYGCLLKGMDLSNSVCGFELFKNVILNDKIENWKKWWFPLYFLNEKRTSRGSTSQYPPELILMFLKTSEPGEWD